MDSMLEISIDTEARRYCDKHDIRDYEVFQRVLHALKYEAFRREIEPFIHQKVRIESLRLVGHMVIKADGSLGEMVRKPLPAGLEDALKLWDEQIIASAQRWGLDWSPLPVRTTAP